VQISQILRSNLLKSVDRFKTDSPLSIGTRGESRGATQVNALT